ncbi:MAG TPA: hypothetical protein VFZ49_01775 [Pyrinomonadaceae bacterium]
MKKLNFAFVAVLIAVALTVSASAQLKRTTLKNDRFDFGAGGTVTIQGSPTGSITVEGWAKNEVEISAEITVEGATNEELERMAKVTGFQLDESMGRVGIISLGLHDKKYLKTVDKKFPKELRDNAYRIDYVLKVPRYCDLQIDGGVGDLKVSGVEGAMKINYLETNARLDLVGGGVQAVFGKGEVDISIPTRSWRGRFADVQLASGTMSLNLPSGLNAEFDATILRTGAIENGYEGFKPRVRRQEFTEKSIAAKAGTGGVPLKFSVGDGTMKIVQDRRPAVANLR